MEQSKEITFEIICDDVLFPKSVTTYNDAYGTNFEIIEFIFDEVTFAKVKATKYSLSDIFQLGFQYGGFVQHMRQKGQINW